MGHFQKHSADRVVRFLTTFLLIAVLVGLTFRPLDLQSQTISSPIPRHTVLYNASRYASFAWTPGQNNVNPRPWTYFVPCTGQQETHIMTSIFTAGTPEVGVAYKWGGGDYISDYPANNGNDYFRRRLDNGNLAGDVNNNWTICPNGTRYKPTYPDAAGVDCSGFVTRVWGRPAGEKWGTWETALSASLMTRTDAPSSYLNVCVWAMSLTGAGIM